MVHLYHRDLFGEVFQLADIAAPVAVLQQPCRFFTQRERRHLIAIAEIHGELPEEQGNVLFALAQSGNAYLYGVETVVEILAETAVFASLAHVEVGCCDDAYIGLTHGTRTHTQELARLEHTQQAHLRLERQFTYFVEEERTSVGNLEIAFVLRLRVGESAFLMSEEFGVDGALRDSAAVDGEIRSVFAGRESMDDLRKMLLTYTGFAGDEHTQIGARYLHRNLDIPIEQRTLANDAETLLDSQ